MASTPLRGTSVRVPYTSGTEAAALACSVDGVHVQRIAEEPPSLEDAWVWFIRRQTVGR